MRSYDELSHLHSFEERLYCLLTGASAETFGGSVDEPSFLPSAIWKEARTKAIAGDYKLRPRD